MFFQRAATHKGLTFSRYEPGRPAQLLSQNVVSELLWATCRSMRAMLAPAEGRSLT